MIKIYRNDKPFYTSALRKLKKKCVKARKKALGLKTEHTWQCYTELRNDKL